MSSYVPVRIHGGSDAPSWRPVAMVGILLSSLALAPAVGGEYYVSPHGTDGWSGTLAEPNAALTDGPWASLEHARDAVRAGRVLPGAQQPTVIKLRGGVYRLTKTLILKPDDSGTDSAPVTWEAVAGELPSTLGHRRQASKNPGNSRATPAARASAG